MQYTQKRESPRNQPQLRGHNYTLNKPLCNSQTRQGFFQRKSYQFMESLASRFHGFQ